MNVGKWRRAARSEKFIVGKIVKSLRDDVFRPIGNAIDEVRGNVTRPMIVEWVEKNSSNTSATKCVLVRNENKKIITLFLIDETEQFVYDNQGNRKTVTFKCTSVSTEIENLFSDSDSVVLEI